MHHSQEFPPKKRINYRIKYNGELKHSYESKFLTWRQCTMYTLTHIRSLLETPLKKKQKGREREDWERGICLRYKNKQWLIIRCFIIGYNWITNLVLIYTGESIKYLKLYKCKWIIFKLVRCYSNRVPIWNSRSRCLSRSRNFNNRDTKAANLICNVL